MTGQSLIAKLNRLKLNAQVRVIRRGEDTPGKDWLCKAIPGTDMIACVQGEEVGAQDILTIIAALAGDFKGTATVLDVYLQILRGELVGTDLEKTAKEYKISTKMHRCVLMFRMKRGSSSHAIDTLKDIIPLQETDVLVETESNGVALIKDMTGEDTQEEVLQFAQAMQETVANDTDCELMIGIGQLCNGLSDLSDSYLQAQQAIELGRVFCPEENILTYENMVLERLLSEISPDVKQKYGALLSERLADRHLFTDDMYYTIDMFLKCDLNISETSRRLYAHRNTLIYRLNSVQKSTGLDLRSFKDAMTFKILMDLNKCLQSVQPYEEEV